MFRLWTYNPERPRKGSFYIQSKGEHAGRPLMEPIPNCFGVETSDPLLFARVYSLYKGGFFRYHLCGSVIPFVRIKDARGVIEMALRQPSNEWEKELQAINMIDAAVMSLQGQIEHYRQLQTAFCHKVNAQLHL